MSESQSGPISPRLLAWALVPIPVAGWVTAQSLTTRTEQAFADAFVHTLATSTFAVVFFASAIINAVIVSVRQVDRPRSYRSSRYVAWQVALIVLGLGWLGCILVGDSGAPAEAILGAVIAAVSIVVFVFAVKRDPASTIAWRARLALRSPEATTRARRTKLIVPLAVLVVLATSITIAQTVTVTHRDCVITGNSISGGTASIFTTCGDFAVDGLAGAQYRYPSLAPVDITTRGFRLGLPPLLVAIEIATSE